MKDGHFGVKQRVPEKQGKTLILQNQIHQRLPLQHSMVQKQKHHGNKI